MLCTVTIRKIRPGTYDEFRRAWEPVTWWPGLVRAQLLRNDEDPDQVLTLGYFDVSPEEFDRLGDDHDFLASEQRRLGRIAKFEETVLVNTTFHLVEQVEPVAERATPGG